MQAARAVRVAAMAFLMAGSAACTHVVPVTGSVPTPVVASLPLAMGIYMDEEFRTFAHTEERTEGQAWIIRSGQLNEMIFSNLFNNMFTQTVNVDGPPAAAEGRSDLDAVLQIKVNEYGFLTPRDTGQRFFAVSFKYQLLLWDANGTPIANWSVVGYGKSAWSAFKDESGLRQATAIAIRDGAAAVALGFDRVPAIASWLEQKGIARDPAGNQRSLDDQD